MRMAVSLMSLDMGCTLEAPLQQTRIDYFPDVGLLMIGTGDVDAVAHDTVLETYDGYLNMGALIIQQQRGMRASFMVISLRSFHIALLGVDRVFAGPAVEGVELTMA